MDYVAVIERLAPILAWPFVALVGLLALRTQIVTLAGDIAKLHDLLGKSGEIATLLERIREAKTSMIEATASLEGYSGRVSELKDEVTAVKGMLETLSIKDQGKELEKLTEQSGAAENGSPTLSLEEMFKQIEDAWAGVRTAIQAKATACGVTPYLMGTKGVSGTLEQMVEKGAITKRSADLTRAVSAQWQWIYRTSSPMEDWLSQQVHSSFLEAAEKARKALERKAG